MKKYLIIVASPRWDSRENNITDHHKKKMDALIEHMLPYKTRNTLLLTTPQETSRMSNHICAKAICEKLNISEIHEHKRFTYEYKLPKRTETMRKYFSQEAIKEIESHDLVIYVGDRTFTRDLPDYFDGMNPKLRTAGCDYCQAVVLEYENKKFRLYKYLNIGE